MVTKEHSAAIHEALYCGFPVIGLPKGSFTEATYQKRFGGAGLVWNFDQARLAQAATEISTFHNLYRELENNLDERIRSAFDSCIRLFSERADHQKNLHLSRANPQDQKSYGRRH